jgi:hypothetical protein
MLDVVICEKMGWDYHTYQAQPHWFVELIFHKIKIDALNRKRAGERDSL